MLNSINIKQIIKYSCIIFIFIFLLLIFLEVKTKCYEISLERNNQTNRPMDRASGILTENFWYNAFYLNIDFDNPDNHRTVGIFILNNNKLEILEARGRGGNKAFVTESGYTVTNQTFRKIERNRNGKMINKMLKNRNNLYVCISKNDIENVKIEDCNKLILTKA